jgi:hypothetical protein
MLSLIGSFLEQSAVCTKTAGVRTATTRSATLSFTAVGLSLLRWPTSVPAEQEMMRMATLQLFVLSFTLGLVMALAISVVYSRALPTWTTLHQRFLEQQRYLSPTGRVVLPLCVLGLLVLGAVGMGWFRQSARDGIAWALGITPFFTLSAFAPMRRR